MAQGGLAGAGVALPTRAEPSLCHSIPLPPSAPVELCYRLNSLCPSFLPPPLGLSTSTRALQQQ